jgi:hypothetical protein
MGHFHRWCIRRVVERYYKGKPVHLALEEFFFGGFWYIPT